jgi:hypothetical protein
MDDTRFVSEPCGSGRRTCYPIVTLMRVESQPAMLDMERVQRLSRSLSLGCQSGLDSGPVAAWQGRYFEHGPDDMESDAVVPRRRYRTASESDIGNHEGLVSGHLLADLLQ